MNPLFSQTHKVTPLDHFSQANAVDLKSQQIKLGKLSAGISVSNRPDWGNMVNFGENIQIPIQRWFRYREGFSLEIAKQFIKENCFGNGHVFDPFCGSGTTLLAAQNQKKISWGIEINPIFSLLSKVKTVRYTASDITEIRDIGQHIKTSSPDGKRRLTPFPLAHKTFNPEVLQALLQFREKIESISHGQLRDVLQIAWLSIIETVSNVRKEGNGFKYRFVKRTPHGYIARSQSEWERENFPIDKFSFVRKKLSEKIDDITADIEAFCVGIRPIAKVVRGDCLKEIDKRDGQIGVTFFSPPYCNCFDYFDIHKIELWLSETVKSAEDMHDLRRRGFCSNINVASFRYNGLNHRQFEIVEEIAQDLNKKDLWNKNIPGMVRGYFSDMACLLSSVFDKTVPGGKVGVVIGNSAYSGIIVPSDLIISHIAKTIGYRIDNLAVCRHLTISPQQRKLLMPLREYMRESLLVLTRP